MAGRGDRSLNVGRPVIHRVFPDDQTLGLALADRIIEGIDSAAGDGRRYLLGCPGGTSPASTYRALGQLTAQRQTDLTPLVLVMMDDYVLPQSGGFAHVPFDSHYSCRRFASKEIAALMKNAVGAPDQERIWFPDPCHPDRYDRLIEDSGGIDLFLLASGASDGHIAFNPPGSRRDSITRVVELARETRLDNMVTFPEFESLDQVPRHGVSVGISTIADLSRSAVLICLGARKQEAVRRLIAADNYDPSWPATIVTEILEAEIWIDIPASASQGDITCT
jgi:glucosamine-6-phosphate deaminase